MRIRNRKDIPPFKDACELLQELHHSENLSISYATIRAKARPHKHRKMEEVYYVVRGKGKIRIGNELLEISSGDIIPIPKNAYHGIESVNEPLELVVVTHPRFDRADVVYYY